jgi:hypothetical protein
VPGSARVQFPDGRYESLLQEEDCLKTKQTSCGGRFLQRARGSRSVMQLTDE